MILLLFTIFFELLHCSNYHLKIINLCTNCFIIESSGRILYNQQMMQQIHSKLNTWKPHYSSNLSKGIKLDLAPDNTIKRMQETTINGWNLLLDWEYICVKHNQHPTAQQILRQVGPLIKRSKVIVNVTEQQNSQMVFQNSSEVIFAVSPSLTQILNIISEAIQREERSQELDKLQKQLKLVLQSIELMCESLSQQELLDDYLIVVNHKDRQYFGELMEDVKGRIGKPCRIKGEVANHMVSMGCSMMLVVVLVIRYLRQRTKKKNISPI